MKQAEGAEGNASKKRAACSPPDDSIERARKLTVGENTRVIIWNEQQNSAPTSTPQRDRIPSPEKTRKVIQGQAETDWEEVRKQKRKGKSKNENSVPTRGKTALGKATLRRKLSRQKAEAVLMKVSEDNKIFYADMLKELKIKARRDDVGSKVGKIRKTKDGNLLIELR